MVANLNAFSAALLKLDGPDQLYSQACRRLAAMFHALAAVVRLSVGSQGMTQSPEIVACHFGTAEDRTALQAKSVIHLSRRVLEAASSTDTPVKATNASSGPGNMLLTVSDTHRPHVVFAVRISGTDETTDILYLDVEQSYSPSGMFDFIEAIARQINFAQKNLLLAEVPGVENRVGLARIGDDGPAIDTTLVDREGSVYTDDGTVLDAGAEGQI